MTQSPQKACPRCHTPSPLDAGFCSRCGHQFRTQFQDRTQLVMSPSAEQAPLPFGDFRVNPPRETRAPFSDWSDQDQNEEAPNTANSPLILLMWVLTACVIFVYQGNPQAAIYLDIVPLFMAISLACSRNGTDRANGWVKIGVEIFAFAIGFMSGAFHSSTGY
jgi:hypothetical protein